ncbi:protein-cysteine N-palmitoyltransferase HHAT isoform X1 [Daphnia magna]|uniref:protein-cysteine N-palmitoyltransferase HHAT isoform X1 n=1 Tax=Daphnia magna TaxID=35525 RepID=UPI001E1BCA6B|nr:protein-cysteine N-palmitoyltransferase HHAT isoform X1 [Daphnia magna]
MVDQSLIELKIYFLTWTGSVFYSMYQCHLTSDRYSQYLSEDLVPGWKWVGRNVDTSDFEWKMWTPIFFRWLKFVIPYLIISLTIKRRFPKIVPLVSIAMSFCWLWNMLGLHLTIFTFIQPVLFLWILQLFSLHCVWILCIGFTLALHSSLFTDLKAGLFEEDSVREYLFSVLLAWTHARSISYLVDTRSDGHHNKLMNFYHYCFYLPLLPTGPLMLYRDFKFSMENPANQQCSLAHLVKSTALIARYLFWWFIHQLALHYFYHSALQYHIGIVRQFDVWSAAGLGYTLGQFFMTKYLVLYGLPSALSRLDHVDAPPPPKCVGRIHLYSQMWRDFDRGLYNFMLQYIYIPFKGTSDKALPKLAGTAMCFGFVCIWHGASNAVIIWCVSNYVGICLETMGKSCSTCWPFADWKAKWSPSNWLRFQAAVASPLLLMSALSNFCFFTDAGVGYILAKKAVYEGGIVRLLCILLVMYCCCQVSMALDRRNKKNLVHNQPH